MLVFLPLSLKTSMWEAEASPQGEGSSPGYAGAWCGEDGEGTILNLLVRTGEPTWVNQHGSSGARCWETVLGVSASKQKLLEASSLSGHPESNPNPSCDRGRRSAGATLH